MVLSLMTTLHFYVILLLTEHIYTSLSHLTLLTTLGSKAGTNQTLLITLSLAMSFLFHVGRALVFF